MSGLHLRALFSVAFDLIRALVRRLSTRPVRKYIRNQCQIKLEKARKQSWQAYYTEMARQLRNDDT